MWVPRHSKAQCLQGTVAPRRREVRLGRKRLKSFKHYAQEFGLPPELCNHKGNTGDFIQIKSELTVTKIIPKNKW